MGADTDECHYCHLPDVSFVLEGQAEISSSIAASAGQEVPLVTATGFKASVTPSQHRVCPRGRSLYRQLLLGCSSSSG